MESDQKAKEYESAGRKMNHRKISGREKVLHEESAVKHGDQAGGIGGNHQRVRDS
jgi:hypothetical protein